MIFIASYLKNNYTYFQLKTQYLIIFFIRGNVYKVWNLKKLSDFEKEYL